MQYIDSKRFANLAFHGTEAAFGRFAPVARCKMKQAGNNISNTGQLKGNRVLCHNWRVDDVVWIEIRGARDFKVGATQIQHSQGMAGKTGYAFGCDAGRIFCS
jgi:hypothetical protein